ncbi:MAG: SRPBCC family protein [Bryobacteraceae bacterium]
MIVPKPIEDVFAMFEDPYNLATITPPWLNFLVTSKRKVQMAPGAEIEYGFRWLGIPMYWRTRITSYSPPTQFVDEAIRSPYVFWRHLHTFETVDGGTLVRDTVDYALPLGQLGRLAHSLVVRRNLIAIFTFRQRALNRHWGCGARIVWPTVRWLESLPAPPETANPEDPWRSSPSSLSPRPQPNRTD